MTPRTLHWFRHDLRLADNPALTKAASEGLVTPIFILDDEAAGDDRLGGATRVWLHHALKSLNVSVENNLIVMSGDAETCLHRIIEQTGATILTFTTSYAPWQVEQDAQITKRLLEQGVTVIQESGSVYGSLNRFKKQMGRPTESLRRSIGVDASILPSPASRLRRLTLPLLSLCNPARLARWPLIA